MFGSSSNNHSDMFARAPHYQVRHSTTDVSQNSGLFAGVSQNPFKPPVYQSLTGSHGPIGGGNYIHQTNSNNLKYSLHNDQQLNSIMLPPQCFQDTKENSSIASNQCWVQNEQLNRNSCPNSRSSVLSAGTTGSIGMMGKKSISCSSKESNGDGQQSRSSSNAFKGDRFIPFRGTADNFFEEFIINNDIYKDQKKKSKVAEEESKTSNNTNSHSTTSNEQSQSNNNNNQQQTTNSNLLHNDPSNFSSSSSGSSNTQYSQGSGHKKKQSFQELITESLFTNRRGSPNTLSLKEAEEEELRYSKPSNENHPKTLNQDQRILSFKEKKCRPSMSLSKNLSLINTIVQEKTQKQQKSLRCIPQFPDKILDAPDLVDDYYLNLLDWSPQNILAVCLAQTVYLWNAESGEIKQLFDTENDNDIVTSVSWMKGVNPVLAIGTSSKQVQLWDTVQFERISTYENQHDGRISSLSWNPLHNTLLSSGSLDSLIHNNDIRIPQNQSLLCTYKAHRQEVCGLKWSTDGQQLASGGNDNLLCIWDINNRMRGIPSNQYSVIGQNIVGPRYCFTDHKAAVKAISWCPWQKNLLASGGGSRDQCIKFWNTENGQLVSSVQTDSQVCALQWNPYEKEILSSHGFINNQLCIWKYPTMKKIAELRGHTSRVLHLALSPDGTTVASAAADETLRFWKVFQPTTNSMSKANNGLLSGLNACNSSDIIMTDCSKYLQNHSSFGPGLSLR